MQKQVFTITVYRISLFQKIISGALSGIWLVSGPIFGITVIIRGRKIMEQRKEENINE